MKISKKFNKNKRAVSPLIATILLICIVVAAAATITIWSKRFIGEHISKYGVRIDVVCGKIAYEASLQKGESMGSYETYEIVVNNQGNDNIYQMNLKIIKGGDSVVKTYTPVEKKIVKRGIGKIEFSTDNLPDNLKNFEKIEVTPVLMGVGDTTKSAKLTVCTDKTKVLKL